MTQSKVLDRELVSQLKAAILRDERALDTRLTRLRRLFNQSRRELHRVPAPEPPRSTAGTPT